MEGEQEKVQEQEDEEELQDDPQLLIYKEAFTFFDKNGDGSISTKALPALLTYLGKEHSDDSIEEQLASCELPGDGNLPFSQFLKILKYNSDNLDSQNELREALLTFSRRSMQQLNCISVQELRFALTKLGDKLTDEEVDDLINDLEVDDQGRVSHEDVVRAIVKFD